MSPREVQRRVGVLLTVREPLLHSYGQQHLRVAVTLHNLGNVPLGRRRLDEAEQTYNDALNMYREW